MYLRFLYIKRVYVFVFVYSEKRELIFVFHFVTRLDVYAPNCACKSCNRCPTDKVSKAWYTVVYLGTKYL